jgi:hypothetical protein
MHAYLASQYRLSSYRAPLAARQAVDVVIKSGERVASTARQLADRRLRFFLRRLDRFVLLAKVRLSCGRHDGKRCDVELKTIPRGTIASTSTSGDWITAVECALRQAVRLLACAQTEWFQGDCAAHRRRLPTPVSSLPVQLTPRSVRDSAARKRREHSTLGGAAEPAPM